MSSRRIVLPPLNRITKRVIHNRLREVCPSLLAEEDPITLQPLEEMEYNELITIQLYRNPLNNNVCYFTKKYLDNIKKGLDKSLWNIWNEYLLLRNTDNDERSIAVRRVIEEEMTPDLFIQLALLHRKELLIDTTTKLYIALKEITSMEESDLGNIPEPYRIGSKYRVSELKPIKYSNILNPLNRLTNSLMNDTDDNWKKVLDEYKERYDLCRETLLMEYPHINNYGHVFETVGNVKIPMEITLDETNRYISYLAIEKPRSRYGITESEFAKEMENYTKKLETYKNLFKNFPKNITPEIRHKEVEVMKKEGFADEDIYNYSKEDSYKDIIIVYKDAKGVLQNYIKIYKLKVLVNKTIDLRYDEDAITFFKYTKTPPKKSPVKPKLEDGWMSWGEYIETHKELPGNTRIKYGVDKEAMSVSWPQPSTPYVFFIQTDKEAIPKEDNVYVKVSSPVRASASASTSASVKTPNQKTFTTDRYEEAIEHYIPPSPSVGGKGRFEKLTVKELQERCKKRKLKYSGLRKAELIALLRRK